MNPRNPCVLVPTLIALAAAASAGDAPTPATIIEVKAEREGALTTTDTAAAKVELGRIPGGVSVIDAESFKAGRISTPRDMLGWAPGVMVQSRIGAEESRLSIRGSGIQRTFHLRGITLLQDGFALNQADGAGDFQAIEPAFLDHVEVYRGANALRYGAASLGGAINFVSPTGRSAPLADLRVEGGSFGYVRALAASGGQRGDLDWYIAAGGYQQEGYRDHSEQQNLRATGNVGYRIADGVETRLYVSASNSDSELPGNLTKAQFEADDRQANAGNITGDQKRDYPLYRIADVLTVVRGSERIEVGASWTYKDLFHPIFQVIDQLSNDVAGMARLRSDAPVAGLRSRFTLGLNGALGITNDDRFQNVGGQRGAMLSSSDLTARAADLYAEEQLSVTPSVALIAGVQFAWADRELEDRWVVDGDQSGSNDYHAANPKLGALWDVSERAQVFGNLSRSYEPPSFGELGAVGGAFPLDIQAQYAWTVEVGTRGNADRVAWDLTLYHAWVRQELLSYQVAPGIQRTINADETTHLGAELGFDATLMAGVFTDDDTLVLRQVYTWGRFRFAGDRVYGDNQIPGLPEHGYRVELQWSWEGWYGGPNLEWQSAYAVDFANTTDNDSYALLGWRVGYRTERGFAAFVEGRNLTDDRHAPTTGVANPTQATVGQALYLPGDGLGIYGGVEWRY